MLHIELPDSLLQQIEAAGVTGSAVDEFVRQAVQEKLAIAKLSARERRQRFFELSNEIREAMLAQGLTEEEILADFEEQRRKPVDDVLNEFDAFCKTLFSIVVLKIPHDATIWKQIPNRLA